MNKIGIPTYLSNDKESLVVTDDEIEGGCGLLLESNFLLEQLQCVIKDVKYWYDDNYIIKNVTSPVFLLICQACQ